MTNQYYVKPADLAPGAKARSVDINALVQSVANAFDKVPDSMAMKTGTLNYATDSGTLPNVYVVAIDPAIVSYTDGLVVRMKPTRSNTGACSINVNGMGAVAIKRVDGNDLQADDIGANLPVSLNYVASSNTFVSSIVVNSQVKQAAQQAAAATASAAAAAQSAVDASNAASASAISAGQSAASLSAMGKDASNGTAGLSGFAINLKNAAGSIISTLTSLATAVRTWSFPDKSGTVAMTSDIPWRNRIINGNFAINQALVSGTVTLAAGAYGHDQWKAGAGGCTYTFTSNGCDTTITITAGTLMQVIEGESVEGGVYVLSRSGTAQARIGINGATPAGAYAGAPITMASATAGQAITVEFSSGTLGLVQVEQSSIATPFGRRPVGLELALCQRYYQTITISSSGWTGSGTSNSFSVRIPTMRVTPTVVQTGTSTNVGVTGSVIASTGPESAQLNSTGSGSGGYISSASATLSARL